MSNFVSPCLHQFQIPSNYIVTLRTMAAARFCIDPLDIATLNLHFRFMALKALGAELFDYPKFVFLIKERNI